MIMYVLTYIFAYFLFVNITGLVLMAVDKYKAKKRAYRIPESILFTIALIGGSIGSIIGMYLFHHKTRHWYFAFGMPAILIIQLILAFILLFYLPIDFKII
jgi:uncharacterized membrane protein YsdA (DUF1294 family)